MLIPLEGREGGVSLPKFVDFNGGILCSLEVRFSVILNRTRAL